MINFDNIKHETVSNNSPITIYVNKVENRITFETKIGCYLKLLRPEIIKLSRKHLKLNS